jgi:hypothetical protein
VCEAIAVNLSVQQLADQSSEAVELEFAVLVIVCRGHRQLIGGLGADL